MDVTLEPLVDHLLTHDPGGVLGFYLYGSAVGSGLRPSSDIDTLLVTRSSLTGAERASLLSLLLEISGWSGHVDQFPDATRRRPIEVTSVAVGTQLPWQPVPRRDFQYGEWLRREATSGVIPGPARDPDVVTIVATAQSAHRVLHGLPLGDVIADVPPDQLRNAVADNVDQLLLDLPGDERNVLLTLARTLITLTTGGIVSKDDAAQHVAASLADEHRELLLRARAGYLGDRDDDWSSDRARARDLAHVLAEQVEHLR
ncbi:aminoglycoside adenylyltransferase domain-containing protein [Aeromicrobium sp. CTD01-1L150]|uniref:aminoglycoside adenylyltransferase domain-containing protein n=1 Tax=Aeromicrobium sp. CTD01-1L150 TaxID=3341830 RepID=UPI0035BF489E